MKADGLSSILLLAAGSLAFDTAKTVAGAFVPTTASAIGDAWTKKALVSSTPSKSYTRYKAHDRLPSPNSPAASTSSDSVEKFERDVATVLKTLRNGDRDPTIPPLFREALFCNTWTLEDWERHTSRWRYLRVLLLFPRSRLLRRIFPQLVLVAAWSILVCWLFANEVGILHKFSLPLTPLSLVSTFVAALLTLRSNQGLDRFNMGRQAFGKVVLYTRDAASLIVSDIYPKNPYLGLKLLRHVALFGWLLKSFLRGEHVNGNDHDIIRTMVDPADARYILRQRKKPMAVVMRLRQVIQHLSSQHQLHTAEELALDHVTAELNHCLMTTERIRASPIPPLYTSHTGRLLLFYLFFLPLALVGSGMLNGLGTVVTTLAVAYAMMGLDEISFLLEQPFRLMPLFQLCKNAMTDVADTLVIHQPPLYPVNGCENGDSNGVFEAEAETPAYW